MPSVFTLRLIGFAAVLIAFCAISTGVRAENCTVFGVTDGDTIKVRCGDGAQTTIRLAGIDAPEKRMAFGQRSKQALSDLCYLQAATVTPKSKDRYGRTVADVECRGKDAGTEQVRTGMAWVYDRYAKGYETLYPLQDAAKAARLHAALEGIQAINALIFQSAVDKDCTGGIELHPHVVIGLTSAISACTDYAQNIIDGDGFYSKAIDPDSPEYVTLQKLVEKR
jgi:endonuclease YncB( thermonuclease family)